jgi:hypothetical protein
MTTFNPRRFAQPECLKALAPQRLLAFLNHFRGYLDDRIRLPEKAEDGIAYGELADVLMSPYENVPQQMVDALYFIHEMATANGMDVLLKAATSSSLELDLDPSAGPADVALQVWLVSPELLARKHAESQVSQPRTFLSFYGTDPEMANFVIPSESNIKELEEDLDSWFSKHRRGIGSKLFLFDDGVIVRMMIRHGMPVKREGSVKDDGHSSSILYRPEKYDILVYDRTMDGISIHTGTKGELELYIQKIGQYFLNDPDHFPFTEKYRLDPLRDNGVASLVCNDIPGLECVTLLAIFNSINGDHNRVVMNKATDVFAAIEASNEQLIPTDASPFKAIFGLRISNSKTVRKITVCPPNVATYTRDEESPLIEQWLMKRGFIIPPNG